MSHAIISGRPHTLVNVTFALTSVDEGYISDGLNEFIGHEIGEGFIADYAIDMEGAKVVTADDDPEEGELFNYIKDYVLVVHRVDADAVTVDISSRLDLVIMPEANIRTLVSKALPWLSSNPFNIYLKRDIEKVII